MFPLTSVNNIRLSQGISESPKNGEASRSVRRRQSVNVLIKFFQMKKNNLAPKFNLENKIKVQSQKRNHINKIILSP